MTDTTNSCPTCDATALAMERLGKMDWFLFKVAVIDQWVVWNGFMGAGRKEFTGDTPIAAINAAWAAYQEGNHD